MFEPWPKISRLKNFFCVIEEKIDGTNAQILIADDKVVMVGSRKRVITPGKDTDNYGFAGWVERNHDELVRLLGHGRHYGEWYGNGIQHGYGMSEKRFALFNSLRYQSNPLLAESGLIDIVPVLYQGEYDPQAVGEYMSHLRDGGSVLVPGQPSEGVIIRVAGTMFKATFAHPDGKWKEAA